MMRPLFALLTACCLLLACGGMPPAPVDRFYRLQATPLPAAPLRWSDPIAIAALHGDSLYAERALVFSEAADPRLLRQYHYQLWLYPPTQLVREHLIQSLGGVLTLLPDERAARHLQGRLLRFDRVLDGGPSRAAVALELRVLEQGRTVLHKSYQAERAASDTTTSAFVAAMEQALAAIYTEFLHDLAQATQAGPALN